MTEHEYKGPHLRDGSEWADHEDMILGDDEGLKNLIKACEAALSSGRNQKQRERLLFLLLFTHGSRSGICKSVEQHVRSIGVDELPIPPAATKDGNAVEMIRLWIADEAQWISLNPHLFRNREFDEEEGWGWFLADTIRHLSNAISQHSGDDSKKVSKRITKCLLKELKSPTATISGGTLEAGDC